jgi:arylsulfatase A-like enzyme
MPERPDILLVITDQQRGDCLGVEDHPVLLTPTMDSIAAGGARFRRAYTTCPSCIATRRGILSGQFPSTHGMVGYRDGVEWDAPPTLPGVLRDAGYQTVMIGRSMHQHPPRKRYGYDRMISHETHYLRLLDEELPGHVDPFFAAGPMHNDWTARSWPHPEHLHINQWVTDEALRFLREERDPSCPLFLTLSYHSPHPPLVPPAFYLERYLRTGVPDPVIGDWASPPPPGGTGVGQSGDAVNLAGEELLSARAAYYGLINHVDDQLRRVLSPVGGVDRQNTAVIFTSDHGEMLGDHYCWRKIVPYEGSARVPMLIRAPDRFGIEPGTVLDQPVCPEDIMPTALDLAGAGVPDTVEGRSLLPLLSGQETGWRDWLHIEHAPMHHTLTDGREKYIWFVEDGREQLFDLRTDPCERHDLAGRDTHAAHLARWRERLIRELQERPEDFSDGSKLIPGRTYTPLLNGPN